MANKGNSDKELMLLLSPIYNTTANESQEKPKLTMKLLYEHINKLKEENIILTNRITEYEQKIDLLFESKSEVASTLERPLIIEHGKTAEIEAVPDYFIPMNFLVPRSVRYLHHKKSPLWFLLLRSAIRFLIRRRKVF